MRRMIGGPPENRRREATTIYHTRVQWLAALDTQWLDAR